MARGKWTAKVEGPEVDDYIESLGLLRGGRVQTLIDSEVPRHVDPYVPSDTTYTRKSVFELTDFGSGLVEYALYWPGMYEDVTSEFQDGLPNGLRGGLWVHRAWNSGVREKVLESARSLIKRGF